MTDRSTVPPRDGDAGYERPDVFFARQPIFDRRGEVAGYELLYRANEEIDFASGDRAWMSRRILVDAVLGIGLSDVTGGHPAFINLPRELLVGDSADLLDPDAVIVEIVESVEPEPAVIAACQRLAAAGYRLALDDYVSDDPRAQLLEHVQIVKVDLALQPPERLPELVRLIRAAGPKLLAEKVEDAAMWNRCMELGFDLFQGYFFRRPQLVSRRDLAAEQVRILQLFNLLQDANATDTQIVEAFRGDVALSFKLLAMANSAAIGAAGIESIPHALRLLGRGTIARWMALLLAASTGRRTGTKAELLREALVRARLCERIAESGRFSRNAGSLFLVGLLSHFDALLGVPLTEIIARLNLAAPIRDAVLHRSGELSAPLLAVDAYHDGRWEDAEAAVHDAGGDPALLPTLYREALDWMQRHVRLL
ncbi:MAG: EAL and HDOD domain-containing protein [Longimicrobiales bacterium]